MKTSGFLLSLTALALAILACADFTVTNKDEKESAFAEVILPGGGGGILFLVPGASVTKFAPEGGEYTVKVFPSQAYLKELKETEQKATDVLKNPAKYSIGDIVSAGEFLIDLPTRLAALEAGIACKGELPDLEEVASPGFDAGDESDIPHYALTINFDKANRVWACN